MRFSMTIFAVDDDLGIDDVFVVTVGLLFVVVVLLDVETDVTVSIMVVPPFRFVRKLSASNFFALISSHRLKLSSTGFLTPPPFANIDNLAKSNLHGPKAAAGGAVVPPLL